jgi:hypothetical protein
VGSPPLPRVRPDVDRESGQQRSRDRAGGDSGRRLARRSPLQDVSNVVETVLRSPGQVGVAGAQPCDRSGPLVARLDEPRQFGGLLVRQRLDLHHARPVLPIAVADEQQDRRPDREPVAHSGENLSPIVLDRSAARAAAVSALAPDQVHRDLVRSQRQPGGHALHRSGQGRAVRLPGSQESETAHAIDLRLRAGGLAGRTHVDRQLAETLFAGAI